MSRLGFALIFLHFGICLAAAFSLNDRPQLGHGMRLGSGPDASIGGSSLSLPSFLYFSTMRDCFIAWRKAAERSFHEVDLPLAALPPSFRSPERPFLVWDWTLLLRLYDEVPPDPFP